MAYTVTAKRWEHGWELHIDGIGVTQSRLLSDAEAMVRDYLAADGVAEAASAEVSIRPDLGGLVALTAAATESLLMLVQPGFRNPFRGALLASGFTSGGQLLIPVAICAALWHGLATGVSSSVFRLKPERPGPRRLDRSAADQGRHRGS